MIYFYFIYLHFLYMKFYGNTAAPIQLRTVSGCSHCTLVELSNWDTTLKIFTLWLSAEKVGWK